MKHKVKSKTCIVWNLARFLPGQKAVVMDCPECETKLIIPDKMIDCDGHVFPAVTCPEGGCRFHGDVQLSLWRFRGGWNAKAL